MSDEDAAPAWLSDTPAPAPAPAPTPPAPAPSKKSVPTSNDNAASTLAPRPAADTTSSPLTEEEEDAKLKGVIMSMRLLNLGVSAAMMTQAILALLSFPPIGQFVLAFYAVSAGCLICCLETQLKFVRTPIAINFGFLFDPSLRFLFYIIMASLEWSFGNLFGKIVAGVILGAGLYNSFVMFKYPKYRQKRDALAKEEDDRIQQKIRSRVATEAVKSANAAVWDPNAT